MITPPHVTVTQFKAQFSDLQAEERFNVNLLWDPRGLKMKAVSGVFFIPPNPGGSNLLWRKRPHMPAGCVLYVGQLRVLTPLHLLIQWVQSNVQLAGTKGFQVQFNSFNFWARPIRTDSAARGPAGRGEEQREDCKHYWALTIAGHCLHPLYVPSPSITS